MTNKRRVHAAAVMASIMLLAGACSSEGIRRSPTAEVFGLSSGCGPLDVVDDEIVVAPGVLKIGDSGEVSDIAFVWHGAPDEQHVSEWYAAAGVRPGDLTSALDLEVHRGEPVERTPLDQLVAEAPGEWILALQIHRSVPQDITTIGIEYSLDGQRYVIEDEFQFQIPCSR